ncbi:hypothetical protein [Hamadaea tsunoensis]|uniref:hypothetical protein n=1 Tax=Hamadaea tsunoensis TaxID=53368 RepID=UPI00041652A3|nr:hypothetical protein [Hamadaea tsunoensis]
MNSTRVAKPHWPLLIASEKADDHEVPGGILVGAGALVIIVAGFVASAIPQSAGNLRYGVLVAAVLGFAALCRRWSVAIAVAGIGFLVFDGFLVNQLGVLSWHGWADAGRIAALGAALIFGRLAGDIGSAPRASAPQKAGNPRPDSIRS